MRKLVAIDPGGDSGIAVFEGETLVSAQCMKHEILLGSLMRFYLGESSTLVIIERPKIYPHSKADPNDIANLREKVGQIAGRISNFVLIEYVYPRDWKGTVPKSVHNRRVMKQLTEAERLLVPKNHNAIDAVGLGLWKLGRL